MKSIGSYLLTGVGIIVVGLLVVGYFMFGAVDSKAVNERTLLEAKLNAQKDDYAKCYNSINYGETMVGNVSITHLMNHEVAQLHEIEAAFMSQVKEQCEKPVAEYEADYKKLTEVEEKLSKDSAWKSFIFGGGAPSANAGINSLDPSTVRFSAGNPLTHFIFTREDVEKFFNEALAS